MQLNRHGITRVRRTCQTGMPLRLNPSLRDWRKNRFLSESGDERAALPPSPKRQPHRGGIFVVDVNNRSKLRQERHISPRRGLGFMESFDYKDFAPDGASRSQHIVLRQVKWECPCA